MKAKTIIHLQNGQSFKFTESLPEIARLYTAASRQYQQGGAITLHRVTDHGAVKEAVLPLGMIDLLQEA
jgi:hypothetical protein